MQLINYYHIDSIIYISQDNYKIINILYFYYFITYYDPLNLYNNYNHLLSIDIEIHK